MISIALISIPISQNNELMKWGGIEGFLDSCEIFDKNFQNFQFIKMTGRDQLTIILNSPGTIVLSGEIRCLNGCYSTLNKGR